MVRGRKTGLGLSYPSRRGRLLCPLLVLRCSCPDSTPGRSGAIPPYLDDVIQSARSAQESDRIPNRLGGAAIYLRYLELTPSEANPGRYHPTAQTKEAAGGIEPPYGALQAPA